MQLSELAKHLGCDLIGDGAIDIAGCGPLESAAPGQLSFLANARYLKHLQTTQAGAVLVSPQFRTAPCPLLVSDNPYYAFARAMELLHGPRQHAFAGVHAEAHVDASADVGEGCVIYPGAYVGARVKLGEGCVLHAGAVVYEDCVLGDRVVVHSNSVIGQDGFGYAPHQGTLHKIHPAGNVIIHNDVEIGANCAIDRATMGATVIGEGSKLGNHINVGHGVVIGAHCLLVGQVGIAGSTTVGDRVTIAGQVGVAGHLHIGDGATIGGQSGVMDNIPAQQTVIGSPALPADQARRVYALLTQLPELEKRLKKAEGLVEELGGD